MRYNVPPNARHGCMTTLTKEQYEGILKKFAQK
jgi:hypothetical protein